MELKDGNWIPIDKSLVAALPTIRKYTLIEAVFSYQIDINNRTIRTFREYERIWGWSLKKVISFIRNKQGTKTEQARNTQETIKFRFFEVLYNSKNQARNEQESKREQAGNTTIRYKNKNKRICVDPHQKRKSDSQVKELIQYFFTLCKDEFDEVLEIEGSKDGVAIKRALSTMDMERIKFIFQWFIKSEKACKYGRKISIALSNDSINQYQKEKWQYEG